MRARVLQNPEKGGGTHNVEDAQALAHRFPLRGLTAARAAPATRLARVCEVAREKPSRVKQPRTAAAMQLRPEVRARLRRARRTG
jgi:hypothetical protein